MPQHLLWDVCCSRQRYTKRFCSKGETKGFVPPLCHLVRFVNQFCFGHSVWVQHFPRGPRSLVPGKVFLADERLQQVEGQMKVLTCAPQCLAAALRPCDPRFVGKMSITSYIDPVSWNIWDNFYVQMNITYTMYIDDPVKV